MFNRKGDKISIGNSSVVCGVFFRMCACVTCYLQKLLSERVCLLEVFSTISCSFTNTESLLQKRSLTHSAMYSNDAGHFDHWSLIEVIVKFIRYLNNSWAKLNEAPKKSHICFIFARLFHDICRSWCFSTLIHLERDKRTNLYSDHYGGFLDYPIVDLDSGCVFFFLWADSVFRQSRSALYYY